MPPYRRTGCTGRPCRRRIARVAARQREPDCHCAAPKQPGGRRHMSPLPPPSPAPQLGDLYAQRARDLATQIGGAAQQGRARLVTLPTDAQGLDVDALEACLRDFARAGIRPKLLYTIPTFHNPLGVTLPLDRRQRLVALAAHYGLLVVEDDAYADLRFGGDPLPPLAALDRDGWVLRLGTYSKIMATGVRVGWASGRRELLQRLSMFKLEGETGPFLTHVIAAYCAQGRLEAHIAELRMLYRHKCQVMLAAIAREFPPDVEPIVPEGGFFIWCTLPADLRATALLALAEERGVAFLPGGRCYADGRGDDALRLAFSYHSTDQLAEGIARLGEAMWALRRGGP